MLHHPQITATKQCLLFLVILGVDCVAPAWATLTSPVSSWLRLLSCWKVKESPAVLSGDQGAGWSGGGPQLGPLSLPTVASRAPTGWLELVRMAAGFPEGDRHSHQAGDQDRGPAQSLLPHSMVLAAHRASLDQSRWEKRHRACGHLPSAPNTNKITWRVPASKRDAVTEIQQSRKLGVSASYESPNICVCLRCSIH